MNRADFLETLSQALQGMPDQERQDALNYIEELIEDIREEKGMTEVEAIASLGSIEQIARSIHQAPAAQTAPAPPVQAPDSSYGRKTITAKAASVRSVVIHSSNNIISLLPGRHDEVELIYTQDERDIYDFSLENGEMRLIRRPLEGFHILDYLRFGRGTPTISLKVPRDFAASCSLRTSNAPIEIKGVDFWGQLSARTSNAGIDCEQGSSQADLKLKASNGSIRLQGLKVKGELEAQTSNSKLSARDVQAERVTLITSNSRLTAENIATPGILQLQTSNGGLRFSGLSASEIRLQTSNARVEGSVAGRAEDYSITSQTSNGKDNLAGLRGSGAKRLSVRTSNGAIKVDFEG